MDSKFVRKVLRKFKDTAGVRHNLSMTKCWNIIASATHWAENELMVAILLTSNAIESDKDEETVAYEFMLDMEACMKESVTPEMYLRFAAAFEVAECTLDEILSRRN